MLSSLLKNLINIEYYYSLSMNIAEGLLNQPIMFLELTLDVLDVQLKYVSLK